MNATIFRRLLWKEFRTLCGFWIAMVVLSLMFLLIPLASKQGILGHITDSTAASLYYLAPFFVALYAAGCGAMLFSSERETRTYWFLRSLPAASWWLLLGKTVFAMASSLLIFILISSSALFLGGFYLSDATNHVRVWIVCLAATAVGLAWGVFFSLLSKRPLVAILLAVSAASVCVNGAAIYYGDHGRFSLDAYYAAVPFMLIISCVVAVADIVLGRRWLSGIDIDKIRMGRFSREETEGERERETPEMAVPTPRRHTGLRHLIWQQLRQSRSTIGALAIAAVPLVLLTLALLAMQNQMSDDMYPTILLMSGLMAAIIGSCVFLADHRRDSVQFLAQRTARPTYVWLSRQIVWLLVLLPVLIVPFIVLVIGLALVVTMHHHGRSLDMQFAYEISSLGGFSFIFILCTYAAGQLSSMLFRSGVLALVIGISFSALVACWTILAAILCGTWTWPVLPIVIGFFLATCLRMGDWMQGRSGWKPRLRVACCTLLPVIVISSIIPFYRVYSIPVVEPDFFDVDEFSQADRKIEKYSNTTHQMAYHFLKQGKELTAEGKLNKAWEKYLSTFRLFSAEGAEMVEHYSFTSIKQNVISQLRLWAAAPSQTPERIETAIRQLDDLDSNSPPLSNVIKREYLAGRSAIMGESEDDSAPWLMRLPWEKKRALRIWNSRTNQWLWEIRQFPDGPEPRYLFHQYPRYDWSERFLLMKKLSDTLLPTRDGQFRHFWNSETQYRIELATTKIVLALQAWKLKHGKLPESLEELAKEYPGKMPNPTLDGSHFRLFPKGVQSPAVLMRRWGHEENEEIIPTSTPFIWMTYSDLNSYRSPQWKIGVPRQGADMSDEADREKGFQKWIYGYAVPIP